jgi:hypothetical protein
MFATSAPYVVTAMISLISWILSTYYSEIKSTPYLKYEIVFTDTQSDLKVLRYRFTNVSPEAQIDGLNVSLACPQARACLGVKRDGSVEFGRTYNVEPWSMKSAPEMSAFAISQDVNLPPDMAFEIEGFFSPNSKTPSILVTANGAGRSNIKIIRAQGFDLFFARNYLALSFTFWIASVAMIAWGYLARPKVIKEEDKPTVVHLKILNGS